MKKEKKAAVEWAMAHLGTKSSTLHLNNMPSRASQETGGLGLEAARRGKLVHAPIIHSERRSVWRRRKNFTLQKISGADQSWGEGAAPCRRITPLTGRDATQRGGDRIGINASPPTSPRVTGRTDNYAASTGGGHLDCIRVRIVTPHVAAQRRRPKHNVHNTGKLLTMFWAPWSTHVPEKKPQAAAGRAAAAASSSWCAAAPVSRRESATRNGRDVSWVWREREDCTNARGLRAAARFKSLSSLSLLPLSLPLLPLSWRRKQVG